MHVSYNAGIAIREGAGIAVANGLPWAHALMALTVNPASTWGIDDHYGTLGPGKDADIVMLRADRLSLWPLNNAPGTVVNLMNPGNVDTVFIAGKVRKWRGELVGVDLPRLMRMAQEARDAVMRRAGFSVSFLG